MAAQNSPESHVLNNQKEPTHPPKSAEASIPAKESSDPAKEAPPADMEIKPDDKVRSEGDEEGEEKGEEEEEEGECGFCLYMKGGGCKEEFISWEKCVEESEEKKEDIVVKCFEVTSALKKCMEAHSDYYGPLLQAEKDAEAEVVKQLEEEKQKEAEEKEKAQ